MKPPARRRGRTQCLPDRFGERKYLRETEQVRNKKDQEHEHDGADERSDTGIGPRRQTLNVAGELSRLRIAQRIDSRFYLTCADAKRLQLGTHFRPIEHIEHARPISLSNRSV